MHFTTCPVELDSGSLTIVGMLHLITSNDNSQSPTINLKYCYNSCLTWSLLDRLQSVDQLSVSRQGST